MRPPAAVKLGFLYIYCIYYKKMFVYWSMLTSVLFFVMGFYFYRNERFPKLIGVCLMACGIVSTFHHARRYDEPGWEYDGIRVLDLGFVAILGGLFTYYYGAQRVFWLIAVGLIGFRCMIGCLDTCEEKTMCHACMHLFALAGIIGLWWTNNHTHN